jgi:hypothetical protein
MNDVLDTKQPIGLMDYSPPSPVRNEFFRKHVDYNPIAARYYPDAFSWHDIVESSAKSFPSKPLHLQINLLEERVGKMLRFYSYVNAWKRDTGHFSVIAQRYQHPSYKAIVEGIGTAAVPLILEELRRNPDRWFSALVTLTGENPAENVSTFYEAVDKWISWGIANQYLSDGTPKSSS